MPSSEFFERVKEFRNLARHELGQNFLVDEGVAERIVSLLDVEDGDKVLEIGPGLGSLSYFLSRTGGDSDLVDVDERMIIRLKEVFDGVKNVHPIKGNALEWDYAPYTRVIGNLPYYITSQLLEAFLIGSVNCRKAVFMVQKEAYQRIFSGPNSKDYGPLNMVLGYLYAKTGSFNVPPSAFVPAPHVGSTVFALERNPGTDVDTAKKLLTLLKNLFANRRKTLENNLSRYLGDSQKAKDALVSSGIDAKRRPETLTLKESLALLRALN